MSVVLRGRDKGFFTVENSIFDCDGLSIYEKMVYMYLCRRADSQGKSFPSYETIARDCGCSRRKVIDSIKYLTRVGLVVKLNRVTKDGDPDSNIYFIFPPDKPFNSLQENITDLVDSSVLESLGVVHGVHQGSAHHALGWCTPCTRVVHEVHPKDNPIKDNPIKGCCCSDDQEKEVVNNFPLNIFTEEDIDAITELARETQGVSLSDLFIQTFLKNYDVNYILEKIRILAGSRNIKSYEAVLVSACQENWQEGQRSKPKTKTKTRTIKTEKAPWEKEDRQKLYDALLMS